MSVESRDAKAFILKQEDLLDMEYNEEYRNETKYDDWTITQMIDRKVAVANLKCVCSKFISHGCREIIFEIPLVAGRRPVGRKAAERIRVRDCLRVQDFVTIRTLEGSNLTLHKDTERVTVAIISSITNTQISLRVYENYEESYCIERFSNVIVVRHMTSDTTHRRIKKALAAIRLGSCPPHSQKIRDIVFHQEQASPDVVSSLFKEMTIRDEAMLGPDPVRNKVIALVEADLKQAGLPVVEPLKPVVEPVNPVPNVQFFNQDLDDSQKQAVAFAMSQPAMAIIHGPPGTGKTTTLVEIIHQLVLRQRMRILVCGPSNVSIDNLLQKLIAVNKIPAYLMIRLGNPTRVFDEGLMEFTLDGQMDTADTHGILSQFRSLLQNEVDPSRVRNLTGRLKYEKRRHAKPLLQRASVVLSTLASACPDESMLNTIIGQQDKMGDSKPQYFDVVIIDECGQSTEMATYIALWLGNKVILAGDHLQLPPTVLSGEAEAEGMGISLMQRLLETKRGQELTKMLTVQYRMNELIMNLVSDLLYGSCLQAHHSVADILVKDWFPGSSEFYPAIVYINTVGHSQRYESRDQATKSLSNELEADIVNGYVKQMTQNLKINTRSVRARDIGIITPYQDQIRVIKKKLAASGLEKIEVNTVDGFQGREKEVIILSLVRSNDRGNIGFLREKRRLNVAITRAKRHLVFIGNFGTLKYDDFIRSIFDKIQEDGTQLMCEDYLDQKAVGPVQSGKRMIHKASKLNSVG